jgi:hypothetical protein
MAEELRTVSQFLPELAVHRGLIPVEIDVIRRQIVWQDLGTYHLYEGFFRDSLASYRMLRKTPPIRFRTPIEALEERPDDHACVYPTAFIFHAGRCGSTLLARALARSRENLVFSEAAPHNQIWRVLPKDERVAIQLYRNLVLAMSRKRLDSHRAHIIKFTSFNVVHFSLIRKAFPEVPSLFLFRDPAAILASCDRKAPGWIGKDLGRGHQWKSTAVAVEDFFRSAIAIHEPNFFRLDYVNLNPKSLEGVLRMLKMEPSGSDLKLMQAEFSWDTRSREKRKRFERSTTLQIAVPPTESSRLYQQLSQTAQQDCRTI